MKIILLCENETSWNGRKSCSSEWGFSAYIQTDSNINILFDTGHTDIYKKNAEKLNIDLQADTDFIVLSHHHWDHTGGLRFHDFDTLESKNKKKLIAHPEVFKQLPIEQSEKILNDFKIIESEGVLEFSKDIFFLGEIPRSNDFEKVGFEGDKLIDDTAIAIKTSKGTVVITGCSHSGICNICEYAKKVTGQEELYAVIGGFHLFEDKKDVVNSTIEYFKTEKVEMLSPMHCVDFPTLSKFHNIFGSTKYAAGDVIEVGE